MKIVNLIGQKFGKLTVIKLTGESRSGSKTWECICDCGNTAIITTRHLNRKNCNIRSCGCLSQELKIGSNRNDWKGVGSISGTFWTAHVVRSAAGSSGRGIVELSITKEYAWNLFNLQNGKCALSGIELTFPRNNTDRTYTASLDRINSSEGYKEGNVQWIHKHINIMKNMYEQNYFIDLCKKIALHN